MPQETPPTSVRTPRAWIRNPRLPGLLIITLAACAAWLARDLPVMHRSTVGPGAFPLLVATALAACGLALLSRAPALAAPKAGAAGAWPQLASMAVFPLLLPHLGTLPATAISGTMLARITSGSWRRALIIGPGLAALLHALVMWGLGTPLPWWLS